MQTCLLSVFPRTTMIRNFSLVITTTSATSKGLPLFKCYPFSAHYRKTKKVRLFYYINSNMRSLVLLFFLLLPNIIFPQNPLGFALENDATSVELPFQKESNLIILPIQLNGRGPYNFILDTGSGSGLVFNQKVVNQEGLTNCRKVPIYADNGSKVTDLLVANDIALSLDGVKGENQSMLVLQEDHINIRNVIGIDAHGVLGSELFNRFIVKVDYENKALTLYDPSSFKKPKGYQKIPITIENFKPYINVYIKQKKGKNLKAKLLIDTGASNALFLDEKHNDDIILPKKTVPHTLGIGLIGDISGQVGRLQKVKFGKFNFKNVTTSYPDNWRIGGKPSAKNKGETRVGSVGSDLLSKFHVIFDYFNEVIYVKKNNEYGDPFKFSTSGINVIAAGENLDTYYVSKIIPNSVADKKGVQEGDELIFIDGKPASFYDLTELHTLFRQPPGTPLNLIIRRNGELFKKELRLKKIL